MMTYLVTAYRWGWLNNHHYVVYCGPDEDKAWNLAESECDDRGGKYGVAVQKYNEDSEDEWSGEIVAYYPSSWGEKMPSHNYRLDYFEHLGHIMDDYVNGHVYVVEDGSTILKRESVIPDPRIVERVENRRQFYDALQKLNDE